MADLPAPVANTGVLPNPMTGLNTLSGILGIQQQRQALQKQAAEIQTAQAGATVAGQGAKENQALAQLLQDPVGNGIVDKDGNPTDNAQQIVMRAAPTTGSKAYEQIVTAAGKKVEFNQSVNNLNAGERSEYGAMLAGAAAGAKSPDDIQSANDAFLGTKLGLPTYGDFKKISDTTMLMLRHQNEQQRNTGQIIPVGQEAWRQTALGVGRQVLGAAGVVGAGGIGTPQAATQDVGGKVLQGTTAPALQGGGFTPSTATPKTLAPQVVTMPNRTVQVWGGSGGGGGGAAPSGPPHPRTASDDAPPANAPAQIQEAYGQAVGDANKHVEGIRQADNPLDYGNNMQIANQIRKLSNSADTGPGTETWHHVLGALGAPVGANNVADYQLLGAYLDRQAAGIRGAMGLPQTNEGGAQSREIAGNVTYQKKALQDKNDLTQSLVEGLHQYREGLDRVAGFSGQASPTAVNQFKAAWTQNFDPNVYKGELAYKRSKADGDAFVKTLSKEEAASLASKRAILQRLSQGQLPQ